MNEPNKGFVLWVNHRRADPKRQQRLPLLGATFSF